MVKFVLLISEASVTAGLAALAVILIRLAMKKAPKRWAYALWAVVFFRCLCPFSAESAVSLFNVIPDHATETVEMTDSSGTASETEVRVPAIVQVERTLENYGYTTPPPAAAPSKPVPKKSPFHMYYVIFAVWAAGALAMALYGVISYILLMRKLKTAVKTEEGVYESDLISTAFSAGFFPPKIYVPCGLFEEERKLIIAHERVHIRRFDYIVKPVAFLGLAVHWFNPLIWLAFALMTRDMELSCDEAVLKIFGAEEKKAYSEALLHVSMKRSGLADSYKFMPLAFAETGIKGRVKNILKYKKPTLAVTVLAAAVVIAACAALGTNAKSDTDKLNYTRLAAGAENYIADGGESFSVEYMPDEFSDGSEADWTVGFLPEVGKNESDKVRTIILGKRDEHNTVFNWCAVNLKNFEIMKINFEGFCIEGGAAVAEFRLIMQKEYGVLDVCSDNSDMMGKTVTFDACDAKNEYIMRLEANCTSSAADNYFISVYGFNDVPIFVKNDLVKAEEKTIYDPIAEGDMVYSLDSGENVRVANYPDMNAAIADNLRKITFNADPEEGSNGRAVLIGVRAKNNELNRQCGADFTGEEITGLAIDDISVSQDKFTVKFKITYPEGGGGFLANENEPESDVRLVRGEDENVYYLYLTADYDRENVAEYAIDICGFKDIIPQINSRFNAAEEKAAEYTRIASTGWAEFTLETGETGYAAYDVNDIPINADDWSFSAKGIEGKGVSVGCITAFDEGPGEASFSSVLDFGDHPVTAITVENMYTERIGSAVKLYTEIKAASPEGDGLMNSMSVNDGEFEMGVAKLINDEYLFTVIMEYNIHEDVTASFAVVVSGFDDDPVYINSALAPVQMPQIITYDSYKQIYGGEDVPSWYYTINYMDDNLTDEEKARMEEKLRNDWWEGVKKQQQEEFWRNILETEQEQQDEEWHNILEAEKEQRRREEEEQRKLAEEKQKELFEYEGAEKYGIEFIESALKEGNVSAAYLDGTNVLMLFDDGTFWYDIITRSYSHFPHQTDYTLNDGVLVLNYDDGGALYFRQEGNKLIFDESSSKRGRKMEAPFYGDGYTLTSYETVVGGNSEKAVSARYFGTDLITSITLYNDGTFLVENYTSSFWLPERPEKSYKFENGILSLEYTNGSVQCFEAAGNDLVYRKDLTNYIYSIDVPQYSGNGTLELIEGTSLNGGRIEMDTIELKGKTYCLVSNETQLRAIGGILYSTDLNYMQQCDIELSPDEWKPIGTRRHPFTGSYNGNGFEIKGLTMVDPKTPLIGMFGCAENANIYNITLRGYDIEKAGSEAKTKSVAPIVAINYGSRVYDNNAYSKGE